MIKTERLRIYPASREQMEAMIASEQDEELKKAYSEMLEGCLRHPDQWDWYAIWMIEKTDGTHIGDFCFKGLREDGIAEIGYGILEAYQGQGYATEAVQAACQWAFGHAEVKLLEAETDAGNAASQRVLEKCGFRPNGTFGEEGPRFSLAPMEVKTNILTEGTFTELYSSVGWEPPCEAQVRLALQNSLATFTALENGQPVGMVRLIGDGGMSFYIKDFAVHPDYQARGTGKMLLRALEQFIRDSIEPGWAVSLELISTKEAIPFYRKMGFEERPCECDGPGMMKMLWYVDYECNDYSEQWDFEHWGIQYWQPKVSVRGYRDEDYEAVCGFLIELNQKGRTHINWNWARFEWMMEHPEFDKSAASSIGLWWSEGKVVGAAIYDMYFGEAFCAALPEYEALYPEILDYACRELKDDAGLGIAFYDGNHAEIEAAKAAGFAREEQQETVMRLDLDNLVLSDLPDGFSLSELDPVQEAYDYQWLLWQGFDHGEDREEFERKDPVIPQNRRHLNKRLSLTALAPDGGKAAYCCVWFHKDADYAYVEPVCTIPSCRGKGIAAALLSEALNRAKALGAKEAYVISDLPFYEKLGFEKAQHYSFYRKEK